MDFSLSDEQRMILGTVREFVSRELMPLEAEMQRAELEGRHFPDRSTLRQLQAMARKAAKVWRDHGAIEYKECIADDVKPGKVTSFPQSVKLKKDETVVFSYVVYKSRKNVHNSR